MTSEYDLLCNLFPSNANFIGDDSKDRSEPSLRYLVPDDPNVPYDMLTVIQKIVDNGNIFEIMPEYAKNIRNFNLITAYVQTITNILEFNPFHVLKFVDLRE